MIHQHQLIPILIRAQSYDTFDSHNESSDSETSEREGVTGGCYNNEPEYTEEAKILMKTLKNTDTSDETDSDDSEVQSSRLENLAWCKCYECVIGDTFILEECNCCHESNILAEKL